MGVLACDRFDCNNIMCDVLVDGRHYVCRDCSAEFEKIMGDSELPESELLQRFEEFMLSPKKVVRGSDEKMTASQLFIKSVMR